MRKVIPALFITISFLNLYAQDEGGGPAQQINYNVDMFPKTPEAASLAKFVDIPAGSYTGVADFTIPLYTIEFDGGSIPVELRYTTTGVKVGEIASRVGLGWTLNTGASLTQQVIGSQDVPPHQKPVLPLNFDPSQGTTGNYDDPYEIAMRAAGLKKDELPVDIKHDIFSYSTLSGGGKFIFDSSGNFGIPMPYDQTKIRQTGNHQITITDEQGNRHVFNKDLGSTTSYNSCVIAIDASFGFPDPNYKIHKIISVKGNEVTYTYGKTVNNARYVTSVVEQERLGYLPNYLSPDLFYPFCSNYTHSSERVLTEIAFDGGKVYFYYNNDLGGTQTREDLPGDYYLTKVVVKNDQNQTIRDFTLTYSYFISPGSIPVIQGLSSVYTPGVNRRLKLLKVTDNLTQGEYNLSYYESYQGKTLPNRISNNQDYWGVFNGANNATSLPSVKANSMVFPEIVRIYPEFLGTTGANKEPDINYGVIGNLKRIEYPKGGYTEITYEADDYIKAIYVPPVYEYVPEFATALASNPVPESFTLPSPYNQRIEFHGNDQGGGGGGGGSQEGPCRWILYDQNNSIVDEGTQSGIMNRNDPPGNYKLQVLPDDNGYTDCFAEYWWLNEVVVDDSDTRKTGNIRVQKIESFDNEGGKIIRKYTYLDSATNKSSGKNIGNEIFNPLSTRKSPIGNNGASITELILSNNPGWQTNTVRGKAVGYDYVQEFYVSEDNPAKSYRKEYKFQNDVDDVWAQHNPYSIINYTWPVSGLDRGLVLEEKLFDSAGNPVRKTVNEYEYDTHFNSDATSSYPGYSFLGEGLEIVATGMLLYTYGFEFEKFPINNYWIKQKKSTTTEYRTWSDYLETTQNTVYSANHIHTYPVEKTSTGSYQETLKVKYWYPQDLAGGSEPYMQDLVDANRLASPVITENIHIDGAVTTSLSKQKNEFGIYQNNTLLLPKYIYLKKGEQSEEKKITYDRYDAKGNLEQYTLENGTSVSIIWGYDKQYPIAKLEGVKYADIPSALITSVVNASNADTNASTEAALRTSLQALRGSTATALANAVITTYTYDPLIGVTTVIAPNGQETYYRYDNAGRLEQVVDMFNKVLEKKEYNFQH